MNSLIFDGTRIDALSVAHAADNFHQLRKPLLILSLSDGFAYPQKIYMRILHVLIGTRYNVLYHRHSYSELPAAFGLVQRPRTWHVWHHYCVLPCDGNARAGPCEKER